MPHHPHGRRAVSAFSLVELLIVVLIIATLLAMLVAMIPQTPERALLTRTKMQSVLNALSAVGIQEGSAAYVIMRDVGLEGVVEWPTNGTPIDVSQPHLFGYPWQRSNSIGSADPQTNVHLAELNPLKSAELMVLAGLAPSVNAYRTDRGRGRAWNDAWGNPLVIAYGVYQPERFDLIQSAMDAYGTTRLVYLAVAAAGPTVAVSAIRDGLQSPLQNVWENNLPALWAQANVVCQPTIADTWTSTSWATPPSWAPIRRARGMHLNRRVEAYVSVPSYLQ